MTKVESKVEEIKVEMKLKTFQSIRANQSQTNLPSLAAMVTNLSRVIETKSGRYQIAGLVDIEGQKLSINLYDSNIGKIGFGNIYTFSKLKKSMIRKEDGHELRLATTKFTKLIEAAEDDKTQFENVSLGQSQMDGIVIGFSEINSYNSCDKHWNKLDDDNICPKCEGPASKIKVDFHAELYIQDINNEDMKSFLIFKRQLKMITSIENEEALAHDLTQLEGVQCRIEYDEPENEESPIIPKRMRLEK